MVVYFETACEKLNLLVAGAIFPELNSTLNYLIFFQSTFRCIAILFPIFEPIPSAMTHQVQPVNILIGHWFVFVLKNPCKKWTVIAVRILIELIKLADQMFLLFKHILFHVPHHRPFKEYRIQSIFFKFQVTIFVLYNAYDILIC